MHIDKYDFRLSELDNVKLAEIEKLFNDNFNIIYNNNKSSKSRNKEEAHQQLNNMELDWLREMSAVLLRHSEVRRGDLTVLVRNHKQKCEQEQLRKRD